MPGYEAPVNLAYSQRNRSACVRIPMYSQLAQGQAPRVPLPRPVVQPVPRVRGDDAWPASTASRTGSTRGDPLDKDIYALLARGAGAEIQHGAGLAATRPSKRLEADHEFLLKGDVFTPDLIETWIDYKREREVDPSALRPHPYEFYLYYDI